MTQGECETAQFVLTKLRPRRVGEGVDATYPAGLEWACAITKDLGEYMQLRELSAVLGLCVGAVLLSNVAVASDCDRQCLTKTLNQYLAAVIKHDASKASLAKDFRSTENAREVKVGEGTWKSVTALGEVQRRYVDPVSGQAGYFGLVQEVEGPPAVVALRLRVVDRKVTEAEWILGRKGMALHNPEGLIKYAPLLQPVSPDKRTPREGLIAAADSYFSGIQQGDGSIVLAYPGCYRVENGSWMVGHFDGTPLTEAELQAGAVPPPAPDAAGAPAPKPGNGITEPYSPNRQCTSGFERLSARAGGGGGVINRHYFADEEAGIGWGTVIFSPAPGAKDPRGQPARALYLTEVFRVEQGKIRGIYAAMDYIPVESKTSGWPEGR